MELVVNNIVYAVHVKSKEATSNKTEWFTEDMHGIQFAEFSYDLGKEFKPHIHKDRVRSFNRTQEVMVVTQGKLLANIYDETNKWIGDFVLEAGDAGIFLQGGHGYKVLEDNTIFYEIKNGPFTTKEADKVYLGG